MATNIAALGPNKSNAAKSMTKDGGIVAALSVVDCRFANAEVRVAARMRPENSRELCGCGQPASPRSIPAPIAIAAKATALE
jgi:hypothetical protein